MMARHGLILASLAAVVTLAGCSDSEDGLMRLRNQSSGPDEFSILPTKNLEIPKDLAALPAPTPGGTNLVDPRPMDDAIVALGGRPGSGAGADGALMAATGRHGVDPAIRTELHQADEAYRAKQSPRFLERIFGTSTYHRVYSDQAINADASQERWRAEGARTPSTTPPEVRQEEN